MPKPKFDRAQLSQLLQAGKSQREIAQILGVSESAVSRAKKELKNSVTKVATMEAAHTVVERELDIAGQLFGVNENAQELLSLCMAWARGDDVAIQVMESQVRKVRVGRGEDTEEVSEYKFKDPREIALKAMAEIRQQLRFQFEIYESLYDMKEVQKFQSVVVEVIREVDKETADKIVRSLKKEHALRAAVKVTD